MTFDLNKINVIPRRRSTAEQFVQGFQQGPSINELIQPFLKQQASKNDAKKKLLDYHERAGRKRLLSMYRDPTKVSEEALYKSHRRARKLLESGVPEEQAYYLATLEEDQLPGSFKDLVDAEEDFIKGDKKLTQAEERQRAYDQHREARDQRSLGRGPLSEKKGGLAQLLMGTAEERNPLEALQERFPRERPPLSEKRGGLFQKLMGTAEPRIALESPEFIGRGIVKNIKERQKKSEKLSQSRAPLSIYNIEDKEPTTEAEKEALEAGYRMSEGIAETARMLIEGEILGGAAGLAFRGLSKAFPSVANRLGRSFKNFAKRFKKSEEKVAEEIFKAAEKEGVDLAKVAEGDKASIAQLEKVSKEYPKGQAQRVKRTQERVEPKPKIGREAEELAAKQAKEAPKYEKEISDYEIEKGARQHARRNPVTDRGKLSKLERSKAGELRAEKILPALEGEASHVKKLEHLLDKSKDPREEVLLRRNLRDAVAKRDQLQREYDRAVQQRVTGLDRKLTPQEMTKNAEEKVHQILEDIKNGEEIKLAKWDYNPERIAKSKELPSTPVDLKYDYHQRIHDLYQKEYAQALKEIQTKLSSPNLSVPQREILKKQEDVMQKLYDHITADKLLNSHQQSLIQMGKRSRAEKSLREATPGKGHVVKGEDAIKAKKTGLKTEKLGKERLGTITEKEAEKIAQEINKSQRTKGTKEKTTAKKAKDTYDEMTSPLKEVISKSSSLKQTREHWKKFWEVFKNKNVEAFIRTPLGRTILQQAVAEAVDEVLNNQTDLPIHLPVASVGYALFGRSAPGLRGAKLAISFARTALKGAIKHRRIQKYSEALRRNDRKTIDQLYDKMTPKDRKKAAAKIEIRAA